MKMNDRKQLITRFTALRNATSAVWTQTYRNDEITLYGKDAYLDFRQNWASISATCLSDLDDFELRYAASKLHYFAIILANSHIVMPNSSISNETYNCLVDNMLDVAEDIYGNLFE